MNRRLALTVFIIDKETSGKWIIKNKSPRALMGTRDFIFNNPLAISLYLLHNLVLMIRVSKAT